MTKLIIFRWGNYPGLSEWAQCNHKGPYKRETRDKRGENQKRRCREFPSGPVVRHFHCLGLDSMSGRGTKIPQAAWHRQKKGDTTTETGLECVLWR